MTWLARKLALPLLARELVEQAGRRRTYVVRVVYASLFFLGVLLTYIFDVADMANSPVNVYGRGSVIGDSVFGFQIAGVYLFLPAMMAGVITREKEAGSLQLLLITDMGPWEILFQKYLSRLVPMLSFMLLSLPAVALAYSLGGLSAGGVAFGVVYLFLAGLEIGAVALFASTISDTSTGALIRSYMVIIVILPIFQFIGMGFVMFFGGIAVFIGMLVSTIPVTIFFLGMSRVYFLRRAFPRPGRSFLGFFKRVDRVLNAVNRSLGGVVIAGDSSSLPGDRPVLWREINRRALGRFRYLLRILIILEFPVLLLHILHYRTGEKAWLFIAYTLLGIMWIFAPALMLVLGVDAFASERSHKTLDLLLTAPLRTSALVRQKASAMWRVMLVLAVPFFTTFVLSIFYPFVGPDTPGQLVLACLSYFVYMSTMMWFGIWAGMRVRKRGRAMLVAFAGAIAWVFLPMFAGAVAEESMGYSADLPAVLFSLSPVASISVTSFGEHIGGLTSTVGPILNLWISFGFLIVFLILCMVKGDTYLGRA
ncbi:MAG: ABC transporter permease subunit [Planctomycetes bacterium]|nr:ABC transporter permease subunit [Planctomycetota bacterium]